MKHAFAKWTVAALFAAAATLAHAQPGTSADELLSDADHALQELDSGSYAAVWDGAAAFVKQKMSKQTFIDQMRFAHQRVGTVSHRGWASVERIQFTHDAAMPDGLYANVDYTTTLATGKTLYEKLSFRLEDDGKWHLTGYVPRETQGVIPGVAAQ